MKYTLSLPVDETRVEIGLYRLAIHVATDKHEQDLAVAAFIVPTVLDARGLLEHFLLLLFGKRCDERAVVDEHALGARLLEQVADVGLFADRPSPSCG